MRTGAPQGAPITQPIMAMLPAVYQGEEFLAQFLGGLDDVLAPLISTLDCVHAYVDPVVAPADFVEWLGGWVGLTLEEDWPESRRRLLVAQAVEMYAQRGTVAGLRQEVELYSGGRTSICEAGGVTVSRSPSGSALGAVPTIDRTVRITVDVDDASTVNWTGLRALVRAAVPAHMAVEVELRESSRAEGIDRS